MRRERETSGQWSSFWDGRKMNAEGEQEGKRVTCTIKWESFAVSTSIELPSLAAHPFAAFPRPGTREWHQRTEVHLQPAYNTLNVCWLLLPWTSMVLQSPENWSSYCRCKKLPLPPYWINAISESTHGITGDKIILPQFLPQRLTATPHELLRRHPALQLQPSKNLYLFSSLSAISVEKMPLCTSSILSTRCTLWRCWLILVTSISLLHFCLLVTGIQFQVSDLMQHFWTSSHSDW